MKNVNPIILQPIEEDKKASEAIYEQLRHMILEGMIRPGERLPSERKMMDMVQKGRSSVREAMRMLERDGYIKTISRSSGAVVQEPGVEPAVESIESIIQMQKLTIENILEFRRHTENISAGLAALRRTDENLQKMEAILAESEHLMGDVEGFIRCDLEFHMAIAQASGNSMYEIMLNVCRNVLGEQLGEVLVRGSKKALTARYENILQAHRALYEAIRDGRDADATQEMEAHLKMAERDILDHYYDAYGESEIDPIS